MGDKREQQKERRCRGIKTERGRDEWKQADRIEQMRAIHKKCL